MKPLLSLVRAALATVGLVVGLAAAGPLAAQAHRHVDSSAGTLNSGRMIGPMLKSPMLPGLRGLEPSAAPFLPGAGRDPDALPSAIPSRPIDLADGDTLALEATMVQRMVGSRRVVMYGFNRQIPGPLIRVSQGATIHVRFRNAIELPTTVHWHGVRLDNRFDGVPGLTQDPVAPGETFWYTVRFPDAGIYWYHPHVREDIQQELGLYGNMLVRSSRTGYDNPVNDAVVLTLDDLLIDGDGLVPFGQDAATFAIMGRFGTVALINGELEYAAAVNAGAVVRYYLTNVSNARTYNVSFGGAPIKLVAADVGKFEKELPVSSVAIAPAQRYVVEVRFPHAGRFPILNRVQSVDHMRGRFFTAVDTLGMVTVGAEPASPDYRAGFERLGDDPEMRSDVARLAPHFDRPVDQELALTVEIRGLPIALMQLISVDTTYRAPVEWTDPMADMNRLATANEVRWILRDVATGRENMDIAWRFKVGDVVKIRLHNDAKAFHPMNHPIHLHGQRFLVLSRDGVRNRNLVWKDTALLPVGATVDLLLEVSNPGAWMLHCHIAEHLEAGMMTAFTVE
ncbi:MAG: multicopper oxidase family protein [Gemmatimonadales bacterium]